MATKARKLSLALYFLYTVLLASIAVCCIGSEVDFADFTGAGAGGAIASAAVDGKSAIIPKKAATARQGGFPIKFTPPEDVASPYPQLTLMLKNIDGIPVAFQCGIPVPTFDAQKRLVLPLAGEWRKERFSANHDASMMPRTKESVAYLEREAAGRTMPGYNDKRWETKHLPSPENNLTGFEAAGAAETYQDGVWYRRNFSLNPEWKGKAVTLKCLSISYIADVWINGAWVGFHEGGYTPFALDLGPYLTYDQPNTLAIRVDNPPWGTRDETIPALEGTDFFNYTGIVHDIYLEGTSPVHLARVDVTPLGTDGRIAIKAIVENRSRADAMATITGTVFAADRKSPGFASSPYAADIKGSKVETTDPLVKSLTVPANSSKPIVFETHVKNPVLWDLGKPNLYVAEFRVSSGDGTREQSDAVATQFGIRTLGTDGPRMLLNEKPVFLAGIARHEEWPEYGRTAEWHRIMKDMRQIRSLNANFVRTGHYPNHVHTYSVLDRLGLGAMSEIPLWQFETRHYEVQEERKLSLQMFREMVLSQFNRPSVMLWSTQNESKDVHLRRQYNIRLVKDLRTNFGDGRLVTQSAAADQPGANDASMEPLDVTAWTMYFGVFHGSTPYEGTARFLDKAHATWPDKPILNTEFGYWTREDDSEADKQLAIYESTLRALLERSVSVPGGKGYVVGINFWIMYNWYVNHNKWIDTFGICHMDRQTLKPVASRIKQDYSHMTTR